MGQHVQVYEDSQDRIVISSDVIIGCNVELSSIFHMTLENAEKVATAIMQILQDQVVRKTEELNRMKEEINARVD